MLILTRRPAEAILIGPDIRVVYLGHKGDQIRIGIHAPEHVNIVREEIAHIPKKQPESVAEHLADADPDGDRDSDPDSCVYRPDIECNCWVRLSNGKNCPHAEGAEG